MDDNPVTASDYYHKGLECLARGELERALEYINSAIARNYFGADIAIVKGEILFELFRLDDALEWFGRALELDPSLTSEVTLWKGRVFFERRQYGRALSAFNRVIAATTFPGDAWLYKGMTLCELGEHLKALDALDEARALIGDSGDKLVDILFWQARSLHGMRRDAEATAALERVIGMAPDLADGYIELGEIQRSQGRLEEAAETYRRGIAQLPEEAALFNDFGNTLRDLGRVDESLTVLDKAIELEGEHSVAVFNRALTYERMGRWDDALSDYALALDDNPSDIDARLRRMDIFSRRDRFDDALAEYETIPGEEAGQPDVQDVYARYLNRRARAFEASGEPINALRLYRKLLELSPDFLDFDNPGKQFASPEERRRAILDQLEDVPADDADAALLPLIRALLAARAGKSEETRALLPAASRSGFPEVANFIDADVLYHDLRDAEAALAAVDKALERRPDYVAAMWLRATILDEGLRDRKRAIQGYLDILKLTPDNPAVMQTLGDLYLEQGDAYLALCRYRTILAASPGEAGLLREIAQCYLALGRVDEAVHELKRLIAVNEGDLGLKLVLAEALIRSGEATEASELLDEVDRANMRLNPSLDDVAQELRAQLLNRQRRHAQALEALRVVPDEELSALGRFERGVALAGLGDLASARAEFVRLLDEGGRDDRGRIARQSRVELAKVERAAGDLERARGLLVDAVTADPFAPRARSLLVWVLREAGLPDDAEREERELIFCRDMAPGLRFMSIEEYGDALEEFKRVAAAHPDKADASFWLAAAQCMCGHFTPAVGSLKRAGALDPGMIAAAKESPWFERFAFSELT